MEKIVHKGQVFVCCFSWVIVLYKNSFEEHFRINDFFISETNKRCKIIPLITVLIVFFISNKFLCVNVSLYLGAVSLICIWYIWARNRNLFIWESYILYMLPWLWIAYFSLSYTVWALGMKYKLITIVKYLFLYVRYVSYVFRMLQMFNIRNQSRSVWIQSSQPIIILTHDY